MCIRDSNNAIREAFKGDQIEIKTDGAKQEGDKPKVEKRVVCLLYTSDAADERSSVDLGGRRIIKKKTCRKDRCDTAIKYKQAQTTEDTSKTQQNRQRKLI